MILSELNSILEKASVPEHSAAFMSAMSGGKPFLEGPYLFIAAEDWLLAVGYPLEREYRAEEFRAALSQALQRTRARDCWAICPDLPQHLKSQRCNRDRYYILPADAAAPPRLDRLARRAAASLKVEESAVFTPAHRRLWAEFMGRKSLPPDVRELFARTEKYGRTSWIGGTAHFFCYSFENSLWKPSRNRLKPWSASASNGS